MRKLFFRVFFLLPVVGFSQNKQVKLKPQFQTSAGISFLAGQFEPAYQWQLVNGFKINNWFAGIGAGVDHYRYRTVPVFISARRDKLFNRNFFAYADAGVMIPAVKDEEKVPFAMRDEFSTGFYSETGIGYAFSSKGKLSFRISTGYSFRTLKEEVEEFSPSSMWPSPNNISVYNYKFHLVNLRLAVGFGAK